MKDRESIKQSSSLNLKIVGHYRHSFKRVTQGNFVSRGVLLAIYT